jgi:ribosomal protein S12
MGSYIWRHLLIGVFILGLLVASPAFLSPGTAKAPPEPVCGVCTSALDEAAQERGVAIERGQSTMTIRLSQNGSAEFVAVVELTKGADELTYTSLRDAIVREVSYILVDDRRNLQTAVVDGKLRIKYSAQDVSHNTLGVIQFDAFHTRGAPPLASGGEGSPYPGADRLMLQGPPGYHPHGSHGNVTNETSVQWNGDSHEQYLGHIEEDVTISFVPEQARLPHIRVAVANFLDWIRSATT